MKVLVANLGSTSFKYRLFDMSCEAELARGGVERIGDTESHCFVESGDKRLEVKVPVEDHSVAVRQCLTQLVDPEIGCISEAREVAAIGFKAVHGGSLSGVQRITGEVLDEMSRMNQVAPAHNPPYISAMRQLAERLPEIPLVAAFETGFHSTISRGWRNYAIPSAWSEELDVRRWGFHGASHRYISQRVAELLDSGSTKIISCHLGGSSSLAAIHGGKSVATTMGMSPQSGLPHNNRVGDFDPFALPLIMEATGKTLDEVLDHLANQSGLLGLSGVSGDIRDLHVKAAEGHDGAKYALEVFVADVRRGIGAMMMALGGVDVIVFTGGIGENDDVVRREVCRNLDQLGIQLCESANADGDKERRIDADGSQVQLWIVPTNEEIIVARQTVSCVTEGS